MGNMSNPCINRWGVNTFWYSFWYSDINYANNLKQDTLFIKLINTYLFYGINLPHNIFANTYWYTKNCKKLNFPTYYRWYTQKQVDAWGNKRYYSLRQTVDCVFPMRLWLLRYGNWFIINLYWFQPFKQKRKYTGMLDKTHDDEFDISVPKNTSSIRKLKTLFSKTFFNTFLYKTYYKF